MKIKGKQSLSLSNKLIMTTQIQLAIKLLQLNSLDLQKEIDEKIMTNPFLDNEENEMTDVVSEIPSSLQTTHAQNNQNDTEEVYSEIASNKESLRDYLLWQLRMSSMSDDDQFIAYNLIDYINDDGYLTEDVEELFLILRKNLEITFQEIFAVLHKIQTFDPIGVGATSITESLKLQLDYYHKENSSYKLAKKIINSLEKKYNGDLSKLNKVIDNSQNKSNINQNALSLIKSLNPKPGLAVSSTLNEYHITPDIIISKKEGRWVTELNPAINPKIKINNTYKALDKKIMSVKDAEYFKTNLQDARFFLKALKNRNLTMLKVAKTIFKKQVKFLEEGDIAIKPLTLNNISESIGMHESTVSRCTNNKFVQTPRGIFELKHFFSSELNTNLGSAISSKAIKSMIEKIVLGEDKNSPLSDSQITLSFNKHGIKVARRTITKYREMLSIPTSNLRKKVEIK